jgi:hypothetical protein
MCENFVCAKLAADKSGEGLYERTLPEPCFERVNCEICELFYNCDYCLNKGKCRYTSKETAPKAKRIIDTRRSQKDDQ